MSLTPNPIDETKFFVSQRNDMTPEGKAALLSCLDSIQDTVTQKNDQIKAIYQKWQTYRPDIPFAARAQIVFELENLFQEAMK